MNSDIEYVEEIANHFRRRKYIFRLSHLKNERLLKQVTLCVARSGT